MTPDPAAPFRLLVPSPLLEAMLEQARAEAPNECCGLLAGVMEDGGKIGRVVKRYPLINEAASATEFSAEPRSQLTAHKDMDAGKLEMLAVYHSHPTTDPIPSRHDRERSVAESVMALIISLKSEPSRVEAWWLTEEEHRPAAWETI